MHCALAKDAITMPLPLRMMPHDDLTGNRADV